MARFIPNRLKPGYSNSAANSASNSRSASPMRSKGDSASPEGRRETGLVVQVSILRAKDLAAKDRGGTSDPYLVLNLGDSKHITHTESKTLNPEWNEQCQLPINGIQSLLLDVCCWDKDRFGKDYLGEFDLALEEIFADEKTEQPPTWYKLKSKRPGKKTGIVSGEVLLQFFLLDTLNKDATAQQVYEKFAAIAKSAPAVDSSLTPTPSRTPVLAPTKSKEPSPAPSLGGRATDDADEDDDYDYEDETPEDEDPTKPENAEKRRRRLRIKGLKRKKRQNPYEFINGGSDVVGIIFLEITKITDLPPESNVTRTSFDMDPFVVASLGKKTYRTKTIRHNLDPVFNEKMIFQVLNHEQQYQFSFTVIDHDKYSGNDFIASVNFPVQEIISKAPKADPVTGLYNLKEVAEFSAPAQRTRFMRLGLSRNNSTQSLSKLSRPALSKNPSTLTNVTSAVATPALGSGQQLHEVPEGAQTPAAAATPIPAGLVQPGESGVAAAAANTAENASPEIEDPDFFPYTLPLRMKNLEKWEDKHNPQLYIRAKYMPYTALRQQFWRALLKQYDADESGLISKVELTTMLDSLGSTLRESTIDSFFQRFPHKAGDNEDAEDLTMDEAVICLEDQLESKARTPGVAERVKNILPDAAEKVKNLLPIPGKEHHPDTIQPLSESDLSGADSIAVSELATPGEEGDYLDRDDLNASNTEEHVVEIRECPICHQPRLNKRKDADIITHIATCASQDWRQVNNLMMGGFVTSSQAQRKWYSKVITKISYGGYKLGANSANILVQDRITGQINEEKMSVYVRLGIRLLYKGLKSNNMEKKRIRKLLKSLSIKQGKKYDDPASKAEIPKFIAFHGLDLSEVLLPLDQFKNFNEFFYRALKPDARPVSAPDNPRIVVSPADCRSVVFNRVDIATKIWIKGREFSVKRLLGDAYPEDAPRYEAGGALGIFRLAPQDYHRFHIPVDGIMREPKTIVGEYYTVNPMAIRSALDVYGENVRIVVPIDSPEFGRVMVICIGAMMVGSTVITKKEGEEVKRGDELGYFKFGGSTLVVLFESGRMVFDDDLVDNSNTALETLIRVGMSVGHAPSEPQWTPDMRKDDNQITEADKQDAKRRIQGQVAEESPNDDSGSGLDPDGEGDREVTVKVPALGSVDGPAVTA
ncbi:phosphatidylserine decarboxylase-domain-containing protein [Triangularia setosa]|uniref:Phosphatidylserine decarboxylase proenzyme 2 n=1 Tax=Triangularia setosa TaxID=2587417 RepID=A0AAN7A7H3_9PEZI|nr:phosphatidylserine decarboxylase-domain-containing protein [Podospora setosa]